jgi:iron(III) transport system permease protein
MLFLIFALLSMEVYGRSKQRFSSRSTRNVAPVKVSGWRGALLGVLVALPVVLGFVAPVTFLVWESAKRLLDDTPVSPLLFHALQNTLTLAAGVTLVVVTVSMIVAWNARHMAVGNPAQGVRRGVMRLASLGYAVPGTILAIGFLAPAMALDKWLADLLGIRGLPLMSSGVLLVICCAIRFQTIAIGALHPSHLVTKKPAMRAFLFLSSVQTNPLPKRGEGIVRTKIKDPGRISGPGVSDHRRVPPPSIRYYAVCAPGLNRC